MAAPLHKPAPGRRDLGGPPAAVLGEVRADAVVVFMYESALERVLEFSHAEPEREVGGFLLGGLYEDEVEYIEIRHFLPAAETLSRFASLTFTHDTWAKLHREVEQRHPGELVLGWHHTHPNFGVFLSAYDLFIHRHFFPARWQVAMVVDPRRQEYGFFEWRQDEIVDCGFVCVKDLSQAESGKRKAER